MKKKSLAILIVVLFAFSTAMNATLLRVNNTGATGTNVYATFEAAHTAAAAGDTLLFEGSATSYGNQTITKKLVILGPGYFLANNVDTQVNKLPAYMGNVIFSTGSAGSTIMGCTFSATLLTVSVSDITIARNYFISSGSALTINNGTNLVIEQNCIWARIDNPTTGSPTILLRNNIIGALQLNSNAQATVLNNFFNWRWAYNQANWYSGGGICVIHNSVIMNNIFASNDGRWSLNVDPANNNSISYNVISYNPSGLIGEGNKTGIDMANIFTENATANYSFDAQYILTSGSEAETAAKDGGQCGIFGGTRPYVLSGLPPIPHIYKMDADPAGTNTSPLNVKISVKSQN